MKTSSLLSRVRRLREQAKPPEQGVDVVAILLEGRRRAIAGEPHPSRPYTPEEESDFKRTELGRALLNARRRVGW
nr:hypothetical protein [uncultured Rhodoferax sp.]